MIISVCVNFLIDFLRDIIIRHLSIRLRHPINLHLELLLLIANFKSFLLLFVEILQVLFSFAKFILLAEHRLLLLIVIKVKIVKPIIVHWLLLRHLLGATKRRQILQQAQWLLATRFGLFLLWRRVLLRVLLVVLFGGWVRRLHHCIPTISQLQVVPYWSFEAGASGEYLLPVGGLGRP